MWSVCALRATEPARPTSGARPAAGAEVIASFSIQASLSDAASWRARARAAEDAGFACLSIADHPGSTAAPFVALAAAAAVTTRIRLAPAVVNAGLWEPLTLAREIATLDVVSDGRATLGIGAGHTPGEWHHVGAARPSPGARIERVGVVIDAVRRLLAGERVTVDRSGVHLRGAQLEPPWVRPGIPVTVGGNAVALVQLATACADRVELTGLGRTLPDGHAHEPLWDDTNVDRRMRIATSARLDVGVLVQTLQLTDDRQGAAAAYRDRLAEVLDPQALPSVGDLLATPFVLVGTCAEIAAQLQAWRRRWGLAHFTIREESFDDGARLIQHLRRHPPA